VLDPRNGRTDNGCILVHEAVLQRSLSALESADAREAELRAHAERLARMALNALLKVRVIKADVSYGMASSKAESALSAYNKDKGEA